MLKYYSLIFITNLLLLNIYSQTKKDSSSLLFFGKADIEQSLFEHKEIPANTGIGIKFSKYCDSSTLFNTKKIEIEASINIASTADSIRVVKTADKKVTNLRDIGNAMLIPGNSGQSAFFEFKIHCEYKNQKIPLSGYRLRFNASNKSILFNDTINDNGISTINSVPVSIGIGPFYDFFRISNREEYSIQISILGIFHGIYGDFGASNENIHRSKIIGHEKVPYFGVELNVVFRLNNLIAEFSPTIIFQDANKNNNYHIPGLTGFQFRTSIRFSGGFPLLLRN